MPYCPSCGSRVEADYHYCASCGKALSEVAESESEPPMAMDRDGFLSLRSLSYASKLLEGERALDRDSVSYKQLSQEVRAAFADFAYLAMINDLNLLLLWESSSSTDSLSQPVDNMSNDQFRDYRAMIGLERILRMYDDALYTEFEDEFNERLQTLIEFANEELDDEGVSESSDTTISM